MGKEIATGVLKGLLSDADDVSTCEMDAMSAGAMFGAAVADLKAGKPLDACTDLSIAFGKIQPTITDCETVKEEVAKLAKELKDINPKKAMQNFKTQSLQSCKIWLMPPRLMMVKSMMSTACIWASP